MGEKPKSIWKKSWKLPGSFLGWLVLVTGIALGISLLAALAVDGVRLKEELGIIATVTAIAVAGAILFLFIRWLICGRNFKRFLFGLACFATLIALFYAEENWRGRHDWEKFKREGEVKGEHFDFADVIPKPVPVEQNFAFSPVWIAEEKYLFQNTIERAKAWYGDRIYSEEVSKIFPLLPVSVGALVGTNWAYRLPPTPEVTTSWITASMTDLKPWQSYYRDLERTNSDAEISVTPERHSPAADVLLALSKYNPVIEKLRTDSSLPYSRFPLNYDSENPAMILIPHLAALKRYAQVLQLRAIAELKNGESEKAFQDVKLSLYLANSIRTEPILISHLVSIAMVNLTLQPIWEGLAEHQWSDAQLVELNQELAKIDFLTGYGVAMRGERALGIGVINFLQHNRSFRKLAEVNGMNNSNQGDDDHSLEPSVTALVYLLSPAGWFDQNKLRIARFETKWYLPLADAENKIVFPNLTHHAEDAVEQELGMKRTTPFNWFEKTFMPSLASAVKRFASAQSSVDLARVAIALERYRLAHEEFPESLDALTPLFISQLPHDVIGGQPLKYRRIDNGQFILYSVGWNEKDDGGEIGYRKNGSTPEISLGDWVWRYPPKINYDTKR